MSVVVSLDEIRLAKESKPTVGKVVCEPYITPQNQFNGSVIEILDKLNLRIVELERVVYTQTLRDKLK